MICAEAETPLKQAEHQQDDRLLLPCEAPTRSKKVHKGNANKTIYVEDQVGFLKENEQKMNKS